MTPLEQATQAAINEVNQLKNEITATTVMYRAAEEREAILKGRIQQLEAELANVKEWSEYHLRCATEIAMQMHNVGIFVADALNTAKASVGKSNGQGQIESAHKEVEKALEVAHEPVQHQGER